MYVSKLVVLCILIQAFSAFSQTPPPENEGGPGRGGRHPMGQMGFFRDRSSSENPPFLFFDLPKLQKLMADININKAVSGKIVALARSFQGFFDERIIKIQKEEINIKEALLKDKPDLAAVQGFISKKSQVFAEIEFAQIKRDLDIKALLTQDEYDLWKSAMMAEMHKMMSRQMERTPRGPESKDLPQPK